MHETNIASDFIELEPNNGRSIPKRLKTDVKICYDNNVSYHDLNIHINSCVRI